MTNRPAGLMKAGGRAATVSTYLLRFTTQCKVARMFMQVVRLQRNFDPLRCNENSRRSGSIRVPTRFREYARQVGCRHQRQA